jgi:hypothetical protein
MIRSDHRLFRFLRTVPVLVLLGSLLIGGCSILGESDGAATRSMDFSFERGEQEWTGDFAEYPVGDEEDMRLEYDRRTLPAEVDSTEHGLYLQGFNTSDDLFMYLKRRITGLKPNTRYALTMRLEIASASPSGCAGIGGQPGESVWVKIGASTVEPQTVQKDEDQEFNVDKGGQSTGGDAAMVVGNAANGVNECHGAPFRMITRHNLGEAITATTDETGSLWIFTGTDSGFEGPTALYYDRIEVQLKAVPSLASEESAE